MAVERMPPASSLAAAQVRVNARAEVRVLLVVMTMHVMGRRNSAHLIAITLGIVTSVKANVGALVVANAVVGVVQKVQVEGVRDCTACQIKNRRF